MILFFLTSIVMGLSPQIDPSFAIRVIQSIIQSPVYYDIDYTPMPGIDCHTFASMSFWNPNPFSSERVRLFSYQSDIPGLITYPIDTLSCSSSLFQKWDIIRILQFSLCHSETTSPVSYSPKTNKLTPKEAPFLSEHPIHSVLVLDSHTIIEKNGFGPSIFQIKRLDSYLESLINKNNFWLPTDTSTTLIDIRRPTSDTLLNFEKLQCTEVLDFVVDQLDPLNKLLKSGKNIYDCVAQLELNPQDVLNEFRRNDLLHRYFPQYFSSITDSFFARKVIQSILQSPLGYTVNHHPISGIDCHCFSCMYFWHQQPIHYQAIETFRYFPYRPEVEAYPIDIISLVSFQKWDLIRFFNVPSLEKTTQEGDDADTSDYCVIHTALLLNSHTVIEKNGFGSGYFHIKELHSYLDNLIHKNNMWLPKDLSTTLVIVYRPSPEMLLTLERYQCTQVLDFIVAHLDTLNELLWSGKPIYDRSKRNNLHPLDILKEFSNNDLLHRYFPQYFSSTTKVWA